ncbi:hypothetical protein DEU56DRAFT_920080 [Suillus clintonianus]|uniref:uncharacterized protein n=1 Tax=Suillus clintonianus TaxID=1904413 RepID=UPI001B864770|nr:uncharacterized protein DEU56DRAFT_920080 [Suillus clintonianus]KAG2111132.1 hypothetical protein DEU56DRAFT_920080 [Suillus clintonianus]
MPVTSNLTGMALPALYSKLSQSSKSWLSRSPSMNLILPPQCVQLEKISCSLYNHVPTETELQDKQILEDLKTAIKTTLGVQFTDLDNPNSLSLDHCAIVLEALQHPQPHTIVIADITPAEYAVVVAFTSEERDFEIRLLRGYSRYIHHAPLPVHEQPAAHLAKAVNKFMEAIPYDKLLIDTTVHLNHRIQNKDSTNIPDLHLTVTAQPPEDIESDEMVVAKPVSKWVGECGLSSDTNCMSELMATTERRGYHYSTTSLSSRARLRRLHPIPHQEELEVRYSIYKRGTDGHFDFNNKDASTFAEGTLYPVLQMGDVERMLDNAADSLKDYIVSLMEGMGLEESAVQSARDSHPVFEPVWGAALNSISSAIYLTAYCRYLTGATTNTTNARQCTLSFNNPQAPSLPSATTPASSSTGLLLDVQPERSAKKLKVQPEGEGSTRGKQQKEAKAQVNGSGSGGEWQGEGEGEGSSVVGSCRADRQCSSTEGPVVNNTSIIHHRTPSKSSISEAQHMSTTVVPTAMQGVLHSNLKHIGTPRAIGALRNRSPALLRHLTTPNVARSTLGLNANKVPSPVFSVKTESDSNCEDSDNESTHTIDTQARSSEEHKAQLVLNATRAQQIALGLLYQFEATEAGRKLEDAHIDIGYVRHSVRKIGITLLEDSTSSKPRKRRRKSTSQVDGDTQPGSRLGSATARATGRICERDPELSQTLEILLR